MIVSTNNILHTPAGMSLEQMFASNVVANIRSTFRLASYSLQFVFFSEILN